MKKYSSNLTFGVMLILIGGGLLLRRMGFFDFGWNEIYPIALLILGAMSMMSVAKGDKNASFWGSFLLICGLFTFLKNYGVFQFLWEVDLWTIVLLAFGISFLVLYAFKPQDWGVLIPGAILTFFGLVAILDDLDVSWLTIEAIQDLWPLILIIIGVGIILSSFSKKPKRSE